MKPARRLEFAVLIIGSLLFAGAYTQLPFFTGNQYTYFFWGLARAGYGYLSSDWLANQTDPVPVFSALVYLVQRAGARWMFYVLHGLLAATYALSLFLLVRRVLRKRSTVAAMAAAVALITLIHAPWMWTGWVGVPPETVAGVLTVPSLVSSVLTEGVAEQYILGKALQPSAFGVLLLVSLVLFLRRRELAAVVVAVLPAVLHSTYLVQAAILIAGFLVALLLEGRRKTALRASVLALLLLVSLGVAVLWRLGPAGADMAGGTRSVLYSARIPHHADVTVWANARDLWRVALVAVAILLLKRHRRLRTVLLTATGLTLVLTAVQFWTGSEALGLMFPWRASVWLVPAATAVIVGSGLGFLSSFTGARLGERGRLILSRSLVLCSAAAVVVACSQGIHRTVRAAQEGPDAPPVCEAVRENARGGQTYLVPLGLYGFRLETGVPVFVDWKSHPYRADELGEWFTRVGLAGEFYEAESAYDALKALNRIRTKSPITHVLADVGMKQVLAGTPLRLVDEVEGYAVYLTSDGAGRPVGEEVVRDVPGEVE